MRVCRLLQLLNDKCKSLYRDFSHVFLEISEFASFLELWLGLLTLEAIKRLFRLVCSKICGLFYLVVRSALER